MIILVWFYLFNWSHFLVIFKCWFFNLYKKYLAIWMYHSLIYLVILHIFLCFWDSPSPLLFIIKSRYALFSPGFLHFPSMLCAQSLSHFRLCVTPWTVARHVPLSMESSRWEYWRSLPFPSPGNLPHPGLEPMSPEFHADSLPSGLPVKPYLLHVRRN